ncbi:MAG: AmmeMemoRadiSam system protein A [Nitrospiraceae bacterium]|nr:MAG: AmmeMemoRadiSam system protein A [Nitrospiraceae bacterium]
MHPLVKLAKDTVEEFTKTGKTPEPPVDPVPEMKEKAGVFVSLKIKGDLRGCIGTFSPAQENIAQEIIQNAISAASQDPRFSPVEVSELEEIEYSVDILSTPEKLASKKELDPKKYGVIVKSSDRKGLLLPDLEGVDTVDDQISIASMKAGIYMGDEIELYRFEVKRYR